METETYKVAKEILEKYAPDQIRRSQVSVWVVYSIMKDKVCVCQKAGRNISVKWWARFVLWI